METRITLYILPLLLTLLLTLLLSYPPSPPLPTQPYGQILETPQTTLGEAVSSQTPLVLRGAIRHTPAFRKWNLSSLPSLCPSAELSVARRHNMELHETPYTRMSLPDLAKAIQEPNPSPLYHAESDELFETCPHLLEDDLMGLESVLPLPDPSYASVEGLVWLGSESWTGLHADLDPLNVLMVVFGSKNVTLFHPSDTPNLYPWDTRLDFGARLSRVDPFDVDLAAFPNYAATTPLSVVLNAGDAMYIPAHWFHYVHTPEPSLAVSARFETWADAISFTPLYLAQFVHNTIGHLLFPYPDGCTCHPSL